jgi:hypothetical protein
MWIGFQVDLIGEPGSFPGPNIYTGPIIRPRESQRGARSSFSSVQRTAAAELNCSNQQTQDVRIWAAHRRRRRRRAAVAAMASSSDPDKLMTKADKLWALRFSRSTCCFPFSVLQRPFDMRATWLLAVSGAVGVSFRFRSSNQSCLGTSPRRIRTQRHVILTWSCQFFVSCGGMLSDLEIPGSSPAVARSFTSSDPVMPLVSGRSGDQISKLFAEISFRQ